MPSLMIRARRAVGLEGLLHDGRIKIVDYFLPAGQPHRIGDIAVEPEQVHPPGRQTPAQFLGFAQFLQPDIVLRGVQAIGVNPLQADQSLGINQDICPVHQGYPSQTVDQGFRRVVFQGDYVHFFERIPVKSSNL